VFIVVYLPLSMLTNISHEAKHLLWLCVNCSFVLIPIFSATMPLIHFEVLKLTNERYEIYKALTSLLYHQYNLLNTLNASIQPIAASSHITTQIPYFELHWSFWVLISWILGAVAFSFKKIIGRIGLYFLNKIQSIINTIIRKNRNP
jgi:hypothetical protein